MEAGYDSAEKQYAHGLAHGRRVLASGQSADAIERKIKFDTKMAETSSPVFAQFHLGRIDGMKGL